jgi:SAM-dependent methyltransferase
MSGAAMLGHLVLERLSLRTQPRVPEAWPIMQDPAQNTAYMEAGRGDGILSYFHLYHALQIAPVVCAGDRVLDLGCGPGNQLARVARLNPGARFIGIDASSEMLQRARGTLAGEGVGNVELVDGDMTRLSAFDDGSMDCVTCTMSLHHLPDASALADTMRAVRRVLKPGGGLYLVDFGRLKRVRTQRFLAEDRRADQTEAFTRDFFHSLRAAFSVAELSGAAAVLGPGVARYATPLAPFMVVFRSAARRELDPAASRLMREAYAHLSGPQRRDFRVLARWFRVAGLGLPCELT